MCNWFQEHGHRIKVLMLFDVGGSMDAHISSVKSCLVLRKPNSRPWNISIFITVYTTMFGKTIYAVVPVTQMNTWDLLNTYGRDYRVIVVGDASMAPYELNSIGGSVEYMNDEAGQVWLQRLRQHFDKTAWLNPEEEDTGITPIPLV